MKTLYLDCGMGAAGDMLAAALLELVSDKDAIITKLNDLGIPDVAASCETTSKYGIRGNRFAVKSDGADACGKGHSRNGIYEIEHIITRLAVSEKVKADIRAVYSLIADAESHAQGVPIEEFRFREVEMMDAFAEITAVCMLMEELSPERIVASPVHVGGGYVKCTFGILPVPTPATTYILQDVPICGGEIKSELCTLTGAALLKYFVTDFGNMPVMRTKAVGYGIGEKDFAFVRVLFGETENNADTIIELCCNLDDMTAEALGFAQERFFAAGALDVYTVAAQMKKSRPGILLYVMCKEAVREEMIRLIFQHTTTLGIRENISRRYTLTKKMETVQTQFGEVRKKVSAGYGIRREKMEYEDIARIAREHGMSLDDVKKSI